jgi:hypothetical protein
LLVKRINGTLVARTLDGDFERVLATSGWSEGAAYDPARELLWYQADHKLWVLDFRASATPIAIVDRMTTDGFEIDNLHSAGQANAVLTLHWDRTAKLGDSGPRGEVDDEPEAYAKQIAAARLIGGVWLTRNFGRRQRKLVTLRFSTDRTRPTSSLDDADGCDSALCGQKITLGKTGLDLVVVADYCDHDRCVRGCSLFDTRGKQLIQLGDSPPGGIKPRADCEGQLDATGEHFTQQFWDRVCGSSVCSPALDDQTLGFLDPSAVAPELPHRRRER